MPAGPIEITGVGLGFGPGLGTGSRHSSGLATHVFQAINSFTAVNIPTTPAPARHPVQAMGPARHTLVQTKSAPMTPALSPAKPAALRAIIRQHCFLKEMLNVVASCVPTCIVVILSSSFQTSDGSADAVSLVRLYPNQSGRKEEPEGTGWLDGLASHGSLSINGAAPGNTFCSLAHDAPSSVLRRLTNSPAQQATPQGYQSQMLAARSLRKRRPPSKPYP